MAAFTDCKGDKWQVRVDVSAVRRLRDLLEVDLLGDESLQEFLPRVFVDFVFLADVLYVVMKPELDSKGITDEDFGRRLAGEDKATFRRKLGAFLLRRGFSYADVTPVIDRLWEEMESEQTVDSGTI